jgi:hypothetical protein
LRLGPAALSLMLAACALSTTQDDGGERPEDPVEATARVGGAVLTVEVSLHPARAGQPVEFVLTLRAERPLTLEYPNGQRYDFEVRDSSGEVVWRWSDDRVFNMALGREQLREGGELVYRESWTPDSPGDYEVTGIITASNEDLSDTESFEVS